VDQGSVVEVLEPKPPGLGELAKDLALRHCSLLRAEAGGVPNSPDGIEQVFAYQLDGSVSAICPKWYLLLWKRSLV
jgi:hypothetical protein